MDKKSTVAVVILFTMIVIGSIVYTIFSVVRSDGLKVDRRANVIKEEMVSMEQSIDGVDNTTKDDNSNKKDDNTTTNSTVQTNPNITGNDNLNQNTTEVNTPDQNGGQTNPSTEENKPSVDVPDKEITPPVSRFSTFKIYEGLEKYYRNDDGVTIRTVNGTDIYLEGEVIINPNKQDEMIALEVIAPESYPIDLIKFFGYIGDYEAGEGVELPWSGITTADGTPVLIFALLHVYDTKTQVKVGWLEGKEITYTIHNNVVFKEAPVEETNTEVTD